MCSKIVERCLEEITMRWGKYITPWLFIMIILFVLISFNPPKVDVTQTGNIAHSTQILGLTKDINSKSFDSEPPWWNLTYHYRKPITITEPGYLSRTNEPVEVEVTFEGQKAYKNSLRLLYYDGNKWMGPLPMQIDQDTLETDPSGNYITSAKITFLANLTRGETKTYYLYYTDYPVENIENTFTTDIFVNESLISNSYFEWWINPPKIFKYPKSGNDWNTGDNGWIGYPYWYYFRGADLQNTTYVEILSNKVLVEGPIYAKLRYNYKVNVYSTTTSTYWSFYEITFTVYKRNPTVKVELTITGDIKRGFWATIMDINGDAGNDYFAFYRTSGVWEDEILNETTYKENENRMKKINGWMWAAIYEPSKQGVGVIVHQDYTYTYYPLYVSRRVHNNDTNRYIYTVLGRTFIFPYIYYPPAVYYCTFFDAPPINGWKPVNDTAYRIAYPISDYTSVGDEQEAYYKLYITVTDMLSREVANANVIAYDEANVNDILGENSTSALGDATLTFYRNKSLTAVINVTYTTSRGILVKQTTSVNLDKDDVRKPVSRDVTLSLADLRIHVESLDGKSVSGADVKIKYLNYELSNSTDPEGIAYFYRVLGQVSWGINVTYITTLGSLDFTVMNDTQTVLVDEGNENMTIKLPMSDLRVTAIDLLGEVVEEYTAYLYYGTEPSGSPLEQQTTGTGEVVFNDIPAENFTLTFRYLVRPEYGDKLSPTVVNVWYPSNRNILVSLPLANMHIVVVDVNNVSIPDAAVIIRNATYTYTYYDVSDESGIVNFTRILFGTTWNIQVTLHTFEGKGKIINVFLSDVKLNVSQKYVFAELPVTDMVIHVLTEQQYNMSRYWEYGVGGAVVYANITGSMDLVSNATDAAGYAIAKFVPIGRYKVTVYFLEQSWSQVFDVQNNSALHFVLPFKFSQITTRLSTTYPTSPYINVTWTENITVELTFYVVETNMFIAYGWINWSLVDLQGNVAFSGFGIYDEEREIYIVSFNSSAVLAGRYTLRIYGGKATYPPPTTEVVIMVDISEIPTELIFEKERIKVPFGYDYVTVCMSYRDVFHNSSIENATIILLLENQSFRAIPDEDHPGWYVCNLPVSNLSMGVYEIKVHAERVNYKPIDRTISLHITEPVIKVGPLLIPRTIFLASVIGGIVPAVSISGFVLYRYYSVPKVVRVLNKIINRIEKGERIPLDVVSGIRSRRDIIGERVAKWWKGLGIKFGTREEGEKSG